jgi:hypothetical protein
VLSSVAGIFIKTNLGSFLLARPSEGPVISAYLDYTFSSGNNVDETDDWFECRDHTATASSCSTTW